MTDDAPGARKAHIAMLRDRDGDFTVFTVVGEVDAELLLTQILSFLKGEPTRQTLWDITRGTLEGISSRDLRWIVQRLTPFADRRKGGRTAIVCPRDLDFGMSRMFQILAEVMHVPIETSVFRSLDEARQWLGEAQGGR